MSPEKEVPAIAKDRTPSQPTMPKTNIEYRRIEDFSEGYANNIHFASSNWDLKLTFGELDQTLGPNIILQHTAITLPWPQVKLLAHFIAIHLAFHEGQFGRVIIPKGLVPEVSKEMPKDIKEEGAISDETWKTVRKLYENFIAANPEAAAK